MQIRPLYLALLAAASFAAAQKPAPLVILSIDGMKPEYVTKAAEHGLKIPTLRTYLTQGTYAEGVIGVVPTVTYPSHTTLVTGVWPAEHGIVDNTTFDPLGKHPGEWYWNFKDIKVPTLYTVAGAAGLETGAVSWPVTVGAPIDYLIAEYSQSEKTDMPMTGVHHPEDIVKEIGVPSAPYGSTAEQEDVAKTAQSIAILKKFHPDLMLIHLAALDHEEHEHEPFSKEADFALETIDSQLAEIEKAALSVNPKTRIAVVSDHGFLPVQQHVNLNVLFVQAGLVQMAPGKTRHSGVVSWQAEAWPAGGLNAIMVKDNDPAVIAKVKTLLEKAMADPANGIARIVTHDELVKHGGFPMAAFAVDYKDGFDPGGAFSGPVVTPAPHTGMHGYMPDRPAMRSSFMIKGDGIASGRDLKVIDMRQIAPTFAALLDLKLPDAKQPAVKVTK